MGKQDTCQQIWCCRGWETHTALASTHCCSPGSGHVPVLLCSAFPLLQCSVQHQVPDRFGFVVFFSFFPLVLRKISAAGGGQPEGDKELVLDTRYGESCGIPGRGPKGLLPVLKAFLILSPKCSTFSGRS